MAKRDEAQTQQNVSFGETPKLSQGPDPKTQGSFSVGAELLRRVDNLIGRKEYEEDEDEDATNRAYRVKLRQDGSINMLDASGEEETTVLRGRIEDATRPRIHLQELREKAAESESAEVEHTHPRASYPRNPSDTADGADNAAYDEGEDATFFGGYADELEERTQHLGPDALLRLRGTPAPSSQEVEERALFYEEENANDTQFVPVIRAPSFTSSMAGRDAFAQTLLEGTPAVQPPKDPRVELAHPPPLSRESGERPETFSVEKDDSDLFTADELPSHEEGEYNATFPKLQPLAISETFRQQVAKQSDSLKATLMDEPKPLLASPSVGIRGELAGGKSGQMAQLPQIKTLPLSSLESEEKEQDWSETVIRASSLKPKDYNSQPGLLTPLRPSPPTLVDAHNPMTLSPPLSSMTPSLPPPSSIMPSLPSPSSMTPSLPSLGGASPVVSPPQLGAEVLKHPTPSGFSTPSGVLPQHSVTRTFVKGTILPRKNESGFLVPVAPEDKDRYEPLQILGEGGVGQVLLVRDHDILRLAAMKRIKGGKSDTTLMRFIEEIRHTGQLEHPNIVPIHDVGVDDEGQYYFIMKYVQGEDLSTIIQKLRDGDPAYHKRYTFERRARIFLEIVEAIRFAHNKQIIHRDIKPGNIRVGAFGEVMVMDWGLSKPLKRKEGGTIQTHVDVIESLDLADQRLFETRQGILVGTPAYMSPEQAYGRHDAMDQCSDIFSLGVLFYELTTLRHPFEQFHDLEGLLHAITRLDPPPAWSLTHPSQGRVPRELGFMISKAMSREPEDRYRSLEPWAAELEAYLDARSGVYCTSTFVKRGVQNYTHLLDSHRVLGVTLLSLVVLSSLFGTVQFARWLFSLLG